MIRVKVRIFSHALPDQVELELEGGSSLETLLLRVKERIRKGNLKDRSNQLAFLNNTGSMIVLLNGMSIYSLSGWKTTLNDGDEVSFLPMVAGG